MQKPGATPQVIDTQIQSSAESAKWKSIPSIALVVIYPIAIEKPSILRLYVTPRIEHRSLFTLRPFRAFSACDSSVEVPGPLAQAITFRAFGALRSLVIAKGSGGRDYCIVLRLTAPNTSHQLEPFPVLRHLNLPTKALANMRAHGLGRFGFTMSDEHTTRR